MSSQRYSNGAPQQGQRGSRQVNNHQPSNEKVSSSNTARAPLTQKENRSSWYRGNVPDSVAVPSIQSGGCTHNPTSKRIRTILVFGESGVGKSSVVNMLAGKEVCKSSNDAVGCTFDHTGYCIEVAGRKCDVYDTMGLNQSLQGTVPGPRAVAMLFKLIRELADSDGIDLLVMVVKATTINDHAVKNYELFFKKLCKERVSIVIVVTGLEYEDNMEDWWRRNEGRFREDGMKFADHACVTATKGKQTASGFSLQVEYDLSKATLDRVISSQCRFAEPWKQDAGDWFKSTLATALASFVSPSKPTQTLMREALERYAGLGKREATTVAASIVKGVTWDA